MLGIDSPGKAGIDSLAFYFTFKNMLGPDGRGYGQKEMVPPPHGAKQ